MKTDINMILTTFLAMFVDLNTDWQDYIRRKDTSIPALSSMVISAVVSRYFFSYS